MLLNLALGVATMALCLALQIALLTRALLYYAHRQSLLNDATFMRTMGVLSGVLLLLMFGILGQVAVWALLFQLIGEFTEYRESFYFSAVNFSTLGYGDIVMSDRWRLLGPLQALNGVLMVGLSTASLMATLRDAVEHSAGGWKTPDGHALREIVEKR
jgi:hypothetical protein